MPESHRSVPGRGWVVAVNQIPRLRASYSAWSSRALGPIGKSIGLAESERANYAKRKRQSGSRDHQSNCAKTRLGALNCRIAWLRRRRFGSVLHVSVKDAIQVQSVFKD